MVYYKYHIFFCLNQRNGQEQCCCDSGAEDNFNYMKRKLKSLNLYGTKQSRVNRAGCFNRCQEGPLMVIYPEGTWYRYIDNEDIDEIINQHIINGKRVKRLLV
jgi:(2Fe-2S) ferredoxin